MVVWSLMCLAAAGVAGAAVHQGEIDASVSATWFTEKSDCEGFDSDGLFGSLGVGYFLTNSVEVQGAVLGFQTRNSPTSAYPIDQKNTFYAFGGKAKYHFMPNNRWVPYLGAQFFWGKFKRETSSDLFDADLDGFLWGPVAGLRFELTEHNEFFVEYQFHIWGGEVSEVRYVPGTLTPLSPNWDTGHLVTLGLIHKFR
jgi:hypothetical protein